MQRKTVIAVILIALANMSTVSSVSSLMENPNWNDNYPKYD
jgi:hypothetical protein